MSLDRPRFRRDLEATPIEVGGQGYVDVRDPTTGGSFRFYDFEYRVALSFDGLAFDQVIPWLRLVDGFECQETELREFATRLHEMGFLESSPTGVSVAPRFVRDEPPAPETAAQDESGESIDQDQAHLTDTVELQAIPWPRAQEEGEPASTESLDKATPSTADMAAELSPSSASPDEPPAETAHPPAPVTEEGPPAPPTAPIVEPVSDEVTAPVAMVFEAHPPTAEEGPDAAGTAAKARATPGVVALLPEASDPASAETLDGYAPAVAEGLLTPAPRSAKTATGFATARDELPDDGEAWEERTVAESTRARVAASMAAVDSFEEGVEIAAPAEAPKDAAAPAVQEVEVTAPAEVSEEAAAPTPEEVEAAAAAEVSEEVAAPTPEEVTAAAPAEVSEVAAPPTPEEVEAALSKTDAQEDEGLAGGEHDVAASPQAMESPPEQEPEEAAPREAMAADYADRPEEAAGATASPPSDEYRPAPRSELRQLDSSAFPVLPTPPPQPMPPRSRTPPVRSLPPSYLTPPPSTLGPLRTAQLAAERRHQRRSLLLFGSLGVLAAVAVLAVSGPFFFPGHSTPRADVRTVTATPGTVLRYFSGSGFVAAVPGAVLKFPAGGAVTRIVKAGTVVAAGDVLAAVEAARPLLAQLARQRERLAFYQQIAEAMHRVGNTVEEEKNAGNVEVRRAKIAKTLQALGQVAVVALTAGEVEESYTREGETVEARALALRMRSPGYRATFDLSRSEAAEARRLGFCQVSVEGYVLPCKHAPEQGDETHVSVDIAALPAQLLGRPARLARMRYDGAIALPASAVQTTGRRQQVLVVSSFGRLEARPVTVAEQNAAEAVVVQGLDSGENVVIEPTSDLRPGMQVTIRP